MTMIDTPTQPGPGFTVRPAERDNDDGEEWERLHGQATAGIRALLRLCGDDPDREGLLHTPDRVVRAMLEMTTPQTPGPEALLDVTFDSEGSDTMVSIGPVSVTSLCEHHLLPFSGRAWIAYLPHAGRIVGLSKLPRLLDHYARAPQVQERLTHQVTEAIVRHLSPDAACVIDSTHSCMAHRGARQPSALMRTVSLRGKFRDRPEVRSEFLAMPGPVTGA